LIAHLIGRSARQKSAAAQHLMKEEYIMKKLSVKKLFATVLSAAMLLTSLAGCSSASSTAASGTSAESASASQTASSESAASESTKQVTVGVIQLVEHTSLDEIYAAIQAELNGKAAEYGLDITIEFENAQGDMTTINTICQQFVSDGVDLIIAIATPAAQGAAAAVAGTDIPVIFSAVTDPVAAELVESLDVPGGNITGTSDAIAVDKIFQLAAELTPDVKSYGLIYNTSEVNSQTVIAEAKAYLDAQGISYVEGAVTSSGDVQTAAKNLLSKCDAIFAPIDNTVAAAMTVLADEAIAAGKPVYVAADSMVADGGLATVGVNYTNLGTQTADMALKVLSGTDAGTLPVEVLKDAAVVVNTDTAAAIGVDVSKYAE
jgi:putative ABC transport system substrate-binding protein